LTCDLYVQAFKAPSSYESSCDQSSCSGMFVPVWSKLSWVPRTIVSTNTHSFQNKSDYSCISDTQYINSFE